MDQEAVGVSADVKPCTLAREKLMEVIKNNKAQIEMSQKLISDCESILEVINAQQDLDEKFVRLFNMAPKPPAQIRQ